MQALTSVSTDDDSGLDTLWLLKKMDSRSGKRTDRDPSENFKAANVPASCHQRAAPANHRLGASGLVINSSAGGEGIPVGGAPAPQGDTRACTDIHPDRSLSLRLCP